MSTISVSLPSDGTTADTADYNNPITTIVGAINGNLDSTNISSLSGTKITAGTVPGSALDTTAIGGYITGLNAPNTVTALGNRSYSMVFNSVNYSTSLSPGMRLRTTRTVAAPTQCTSLNGTTQYYSKTSPAGMTFTNNFVVSAWVKVSSYTQGMIVSRYNGTSGWYIQMLATGQIQIAGLNAGAGNNSTATSYQSIPLNKWVHITGQLDMATFTATTTTSYIMIDGVDVPTTVARNGTNPTSLIQAGNLEIGSWNGGLLPFPGKIAQVAIYSAKVTQATILASMHQGLAGTETSLISAYSFNNSINDLNANANNLTANGSAVATNADSPFGGQAGGTISSTLDYGIVQSVSFSTNTTVVVQVPEGCTIPTSGGVSAVVYSSNKAPYGMPVQRTKWDILSLQKANASTTLGSLGVDTTTNWTVTAPIGEWNIRFDMFGTGQGSGTGSGNNDVAFLVKGASTGNLTGMYIRGAYNTGATATGLFVSGHGETKISQSASEVYSVYANMAAYTGGTATVGLRGDVANAGNVLAIENAYL